MSVLSPEDTLYISKPIIHVIDIIPDIIAIKVDNYINKNKIYFFQVLKIFIFTENLIGIVEL